MWNATIGLVAAMVFRQRLIPPPKIQLPRISSNVLGRDRLFSAAGWVDEHGIGPGEPGVVVTVCAPAGYGKTTLLARYARTLREAGLPVGWVTCDRHDADPAMLWNAILAALSRAAQDDPADAGPDAFASMEPPREVDPAFLAEFAEAIDAHGTPITLVLDDVHELADRKTLDCLADLLRNLPEQLRLCIGSRREPAILLHRLRLDGRLREVQARDLAFTRAESAAVLRAQGTELADEDITTLWHRTEGWPAAVRLVSLALAQEDSPQRFIAQFAGHDRAVADYLVAEILGHQPEHVQRFLLDTSVAEELSSGLAAALSGRYDAGAVLEGLERANALVQPLGRAGEWYRYHALLRTYLCNELRRRDQGAVAERHRRAATWYRDAGLPGPALEHAVVAGDDAMVRALLTRYGLRLLLSGGGLRLRHLLADCASGVLDDAEVQLIAALAALDAGDLVAGDEALARVRPMQGAAVCDRVRRLHEAALLQRARLRGDTTILAELSLDRPGRTGSPTSADGDIELLILANRGAVRIPAGDYLSARADLLAALELSRRRGHHHLTLECLNQLTGAAGTLSEMFDARRWAQEAIALAVARGWASSPRLAYAHCLAAWSAYLMLDLDDAARHASESVAVLRGGVVEPEVEMAARCGEAVIAFDNYPQRDEALRRLRRLWQPVPETRHSTALIAFAHLAELRMCLALGERSHAATVVARIEELIPGAGDAAVARGLVLLDRHRYDQARAAVRPCVSGERATVVMTAEITAWLIEAVAAAHARALDTAHRALLNALEIGARTRLMRPFYDLGRPVRDLLGAAVGRAGRSEAFLADLLAACAAAQTWQNATVAGAVAPVDPGQPVDLAVPLTTREIELLRDLPSMLTTEEIAAAHMVSVNTVKTHLRSLYRKLDAPSRREAVAAARRLCLL